MRWALALILISGLAVRLGWGWAQTSDERQIRAALPDQWEYLSLGRNLLDGEGLQFYDERFNDTLWAYRMPGYPLFVAACGADVRVVRAAQAVIDTATALGVFLLARRWLEIRRALLAAALVAFNPFLIYFSALILSESLFTAMLVWGMMLLGSPIAIRRDRGLQSLAGPGRVWAFLGGGTILALSILVRPSAVALPVAVGLSAVVMNRGRWSAYEARRLPVVSCLLILTLGVLLPWAWRNHLRLGQWVWTTTNAGVTAYDGFHPDATGASDQRFLRAMPQLRSMGEVERSQYLSQRAQQYARQNPSRAVELAARKVARTWSPMPLSQDYSRPIYRTVGLLFSLPLDVLILIGLWRGELPRSAKAYLLLPAIYFTAVHALSVGSLRYRVPTEPPMAVLAAAALVRRTAKTVEPQMNADERG